MGRLIVITKHIFRKFAFALLGVLILTQAAHLALAYV